MIACFDIGGSAIKGAVARAPDDMVLLGREPTPLHDFEAFAAAISVMMAQGENRPERVALSITGVVDPETNATKCANIPCIDGRQLADDLQARLGLPVLIANDADCFALAEAGIGAGRGHRIVLGAILGTGVGGGLVVDGRLVNAAGGFAGEWGHGPAVAATAGNPPVAIPPFSCGCGQLRCVDSVGGARGMERLHVHLHGKALPSDLITAAYQAGDAEAARTIDVLVDLVSSPLALTVNITGASIVPVGGGLSSVAPLIAAIDKAVRERTLRSFGRPLVVPAECRVEPGLIGAAILALQGEAA